MQEGRFLSRVYRLRFEPDRRIRNEVWKVLCSDFFQRYIPHHAKVLDMAVGYGEFINNISASKKYALDLNADSRMHVNGDVTFFCCDSAAIEGLEDSSIDVVFVSNFFEHLTKDEIVATIREIDRVLRPEGELLIIGPNMRFCYDRYWSFFDHITPLDDASLCEVLRLHGFEVLERIARFLPYTMRSRLPKSPSLVRWYLRMPFLWRLFGEQMFIRARKGVSSHGM